MSKNKFIILPIILFIFVSLFSCDRFMEAVGGKAIKSKLTDEEQKSFKGCLNIKQTEFEDAVKYLPVLVKGDPDTITWYEEYEQEMAEIGMELDRTVLYQQDICALIGAFSRAKDKEAYLLMLQIIEQKTDYPEARLCAIKAVKTYGEFIQGEWFGDTRGISVLKQAIKDKNPDIRLQSSGALLSLGQGDIALPVLEEIAEEGQYQPPLSPFDMLFSPEEREFNGKMSVVISETRLFDERGKDLLIRALDFPIDMVKMDAALRLEALGMERKRVEATAIEVLERLINKKRPDHDETGQWDGIRRAGIDAVNLLMKIKSWTGIDVLEKLVNNTNDEMLKYRAKIALTTIKQK